MPWSRHAPSWLLSLPENHGLGLTQTAPLLHLSKGENWRLRSEIRTTLFEDTSGAMVVILTLSDFSPISSTI